MNIWKLWLTSPQRDLVMIVWCFQSTQTLTPTSPFPPSLRKPASRLFVWYQVSIVNRFHLNSTTIHLFICSNLIYFGKQNKCPEQSTKGNKVPECLFGKDKFDEANINHSKPSFGGKWRLPNCALTNFYFRLAEKNFFWVPNGTAITTT